MTFKRVSSAGADREAFGLTDILRNADFRRAWLIGIASGGVRWLELLAFGIYVFDQTGSAFLVATFTLLRLLPFSLFGVVTGALVDRLGQRKVLRLSLLAMVAASGVLAALSYSGQLALWHLALGTILSGMYWTTDFSARRNLLGQLAGPDNLSKALSFDAASNTLTRAIGPIFGGILIATLGFSGVLLLSFSLYAAALVLALQFSKVGGESEEGKHGLLRGIVDAFVFAVRWRKLVAAFVVTIIFNLFGFPFTALIPVIGKQTLGLTPDAVGLIAALEGSGAIIGSLLVSRARAEGQIWGRYIGGVLLCMAGVVILGFAQDVPMAATGIGIAGIGAGLFAASQVTLIYRLSPPEQRSRMLGLLTICIGTAPIGFAYLGALADVFGSGPALLIMTALGFVSMLLFWIYFPVSEYLRSRTTE